MNQRTQERRMKQLGFKVKVQPPNSPSFVRIIVPTLTPDFFSRGQRYLALHLCKLIDFTTLCLPLYSTEPDENVVLYMMKYQLEISVSMYTQTSPKYPLFIDSSLDNVRKTSRHMRHELRHPEITSPYAISTSIDVNIDPETRKPKAIPDWWKQKYGPLHGVTQNNVQNARPSVKPQNGVFLREFMIHFWDTDNNRHTNFSSYIRICLDSLYEQASGNNHDHDELKVALRGWVSKIHIVFKSDSKLGDVLRVEFWKDGTTGNTFHFEIKKINTVIVTATLAFHQTQTQSRSRSSL